MVLKIISVGATEQDPSPDNNELRVIHNERCLGGFIEIASLFLPALLVFLLMSTDVPREVRRPVRVINP